MAAQDEAVRDLGLAIPYPAALEQVLRQAADGVVVVNRDGRLILVNEAAARTAQHRPEGETLDSLPLTWGALYKDGTVVPKEKYALAQALQGRAVKDKEARIVHDDGTFFDVRISAAPVRGPDGEVVAAIATFSDITERKRAEAELRASERRTRGMFDATFQFEGLLDLQGVVLDANRAALDFINCELSAVVGTPFIETPWWRDLPDSKQRLRSATAEAAQGRFVRCEVQHRNAAGEVHDFDFSLKPLSDDAGRICYLVAEGRDITERRQAEAALRESEQRYRSVTDLSPDAILINSEGRFAYANRAAASLLGAGAPDTLIGRTPYELIEPAYHDLVRERIELVLHGDETVAVIEQRWRRLDGSVLDVEIAAARIAWDGKPAVQVLVRDSSERKRAEAALRESGEAARRALSELEAIYADAPVGLCILSTDARYLRINERLAQINGLPVAAHIGRSVREIVPWIADQAEALIVSITQTGNSRLNVEIEGETTAQPGVRRTWLEHWSPVKDDAGNVIAINVVVEEITQRKRQEEEMQILVRELSHRSKNLLAVVHAIVRQTAQHADGMGAFMAQLDSRIGALAHAHDLLTEQNWQGAGLRDLIASQLQPFVDLRTGRVALAGPPLSLSAQATQQLALALHELATNACKHGALSVPDGSVAIDWTAEPHEGSNSTFSIKWAERGGPPIKPPKRRGFGAMVLERLVPMSLNGHAELTYAPDGIEWTLASENASFCRETQDASAPEMA